MSKMNVFPLRPTIVVGDEDHRKLMNLAMSGFGAAQDAADELLTELERAKVKPTSTISGDIVRMGSTVSYRTEDDKGRTVRLVYPAEADISNGSVSVLTPIGTALIGLRIGQTITWTARDGRRHSLTVLDVSSPDRPAPDGPGAA